MEWQTELAAGTRVIIRTRPKSGRCEVVNSVERLQPLTPVCVLMEDGRKEWVSGMDLLLDAERA